jgi:hypothetical protein
MKPLLSDDLITAVASSEHHTAEIQERLFVAEVSEIMWSLVERESVGMPPQPRSDVDVLDVFSRLMAARDRFVSSSLRGEKP